jgi:rhodanese-related sulfurtransferase
MSRSHAHSESGHSDALIVILGALAIVIGASALGLAINHFSRRGIPLFAGTSVGHQLVRPERSRRAPAPGSVRQGLAPATAVPLPKGISSITIIEAKTALDNHLALFLDSRPPDQYAEGHIPGALSLPADTFDDAFPDLADKIEASPFLIIYCEGAECSDAIHVAERLTEYGFLGTRVMMDGFRAWVDAGNPVTVGSSP